MKIKVYCDGVKYHYRRTAIRAADGTWYTAWLSAPYTGIGRVSKENDPLWVRHFWWKWTCEGKHITRELINKPVMYGGSRYGYNMCMQNLKKHMEIYHGSTLSAK